MHYTRFKRHGGPLMTKTAPEGAGMAFLFSAISNVTKGCVNWPYSTSGDGYGQTYYQGKVVQTHRLICRLVHGEPPTESHQAAHRCGNASCVNPAHIRWRTPAQNIAEKEKHGTKLIGVATTSAKLSDSAVKEILALRGQITQKQIANLYGVSSHAIYCIFKNKSWVHIPRPTVCD